MKNNGERSVLTLGSLCLPSCDPFARDTAGSRFNLKVELYTYISHIILLFIRIKFSSQISNTVMFIFLI